MGGTQLRLREAEHACAVILHRVERRPVSLRQAIEELKPPVPRGLLNALCLGVLRNYKLAERALRLCGHKGGTRRSPHGWLPVIAAYEAMFRPSLSLSRISEKTGLPEQLLACIRRMSPEDVVRGVKEETRRLALLYSLPRWVVEELARLNPPGGLEKLLRSLQEPAPLWIRYNRRLLGPDEALRRLRKAGIEARHDPLLDDMVEAVSVEPGAPERLSPRLFYIEDRAPAAAVHMLSSFLAPGVRVVDLFSAPGNKVAHLAWRLPIEAFTLDISWRRLVTEKKLHWSQSVDGYMLYAAGDAAKPPLRGGFDAAIVDPDCTSLGRLAHSPETRLFLERVGRLLLKRVTALQEKGIRTAATLVKRGGHVLYTTCTLTLQENEEVVRKLVEEGLLEPVEAGSRVGVPGGVPGSQRFYPHISRSTGGFAAVLQRL